MDHDVILKKFSYTNPRVDGGPSTPSRLSPTDWKEMERLVRRVVEDNDARSTRQLKSTIHHLSVEDGLLSHENNGLQASLATKNKRKKYGKPLELHQREEYHSGAVFWSPRKIREARAREVVKQRDEQEKKLKKFEMKELRESAKLYKQKVAEEKRVERERVRMAREKERAEKAAEKQHQKEMRDSAKALQLSQLGKRKASKSSLTPNKRRKQMGGAGASVVAVVEPSALPTRVTSRGRNVSLPSKFR